jgi:hypothetical protein
MVVMGATINEVEVLIHRGRLVPQRRVVVMAAVDVVDRGGRGELVVGVVVGETAVAEGGTGHGDRGEGREAT